MKKILLFSFLLLLGLVTSQQTLFLSETNRNVFDLVVKNMTLVALAFIMIHVGLEFIIDKSNLAGYGWDYFVAFTAAALPWIFCSLYFFYAYEHSQEFPKINIVVDILLLARFASPTSAGVLFAMLAAAGLEESWVFKKARILAIFDDLDTIILLVPIKMLIMGFRWELIFLLLIIGGLIYLAWKKMHSISLPLNWPWILFYSIVITAACEFIYYTTKYLEDVVPIQIELLLPAFVFGSILAHPNGNIHEFFAQPNEQRAKTLISAIFMFLVGASMPAIGMINNSAFATLSLSRVLWDIVIITVISNLGKMFPLFCYRKEASVKERLALSIGMFPRGEVGAGVIMISLGLIKYLDKGLIIVAMLSLAMNLMLTGPFIMAIQKLLCSERK